MRMRAAPLLLAALVAAGCGGSGPSGATTNREPVESARQALADAVHAARRASSLHVAGTLSSLTLNLTLARGAGAKGSVTQNGLAFNLVRVGSKVYIQGSEAFWKHYAPSAAGLLRGHWIAGPVGKGRFAELAPLTDASRLFALVEASHGRLVNKGLTAYDGHKVAEILDTSDGSKLYVAATGPPYPVALIGGRKHPHDQLRFDDWNAQVSVSVPPHAIDLTALGLG